MKNSQGVTNLATVVLAELDSADSGPNLKLYTADLISRVILEHQRQQPGVWQEWTTEMKKGEVSRWIREAARLGETSAERIYLKCVDLN